MAEAGGKGAGFWNRLKRNLRENRRLDTSEPNLRRGDPCGFFTVIHKGCKKFATLLPSNWLAETPETFTSRRLGRQSAERERISGID
ncbi:hypothetical protein ACDX66_18770 [Peribacillus frigoritolerans]